MFPDFALESGTRMRKFYDYLWSVWSGEVLLHSPCDLSVASPGSCLPFTASWTHSHCPTPPLRVSINPLMISVCKQQNRWRTCFVFFQFDFFLFPHDRNNTCLLQKSKPERIRAREMCESSSKSYALEITAFNSLCFLLCVRVYKAMSQNHLSTHTMFVLHFFPTWWLYRNLCSGCHIISSKIPSWWTTRLFFALKTLLAYLIADISSNCRTSKKF